MYRFRNHIIVGTISIAALASGTSYYLHGKSIPLTPFVYERDIADVLSIFDRNWRWLMPYEKETYDSNYLPYVFEHRAPHGDPAKQGKINVMTIRQDNKVIAFVAYYMKTRTSGFLLFVAVDNAHRGKKYGEYLVRYAIDKMIKLGAKQVQLLTRIDNIPAQKVYRRVGFTETTRDGEFVYYTYKK